jgi:glutaconate CoA-transferase subunit B
VMANSKEVFVVMRRHEGRSLVEALDFCTSPGPDRALAEGFSPRGAGVTKVITELGILSRSGPGEELQLTAVHPGVDVATVVEATGWELKVADEVQTIPAPTAQELELLRTKVDPDKIYLR